MILHLLMDDKFTPEYIDFVQENFNHKFSEHRFLIISTHDPLKYAPEKKYESITIVRKRLRDLFFLWSQLIKSDKIIIHGLFNKEMMLSLLLTRSSKKAIWALWGGDLYNYNNEKKWLFKVKHSIIERLSGIATPIEGDCDLARKIYGFSGQYYPCLLYLSNVAKGQRHEPKGDRTRKTIIIGNSASAENNHKFIVDKLRGLDLHNDRIIVPLSYGANKDKTDAIQKYIEDNVNSKIFCLREMMGKREYLELLENVDIALYAHNRQQGLGNIINLLSMGVKIYIRSDIVTYKWLTDMGIKVFDVEDVDVTLGTDISEEDKRNNIDIITKMASIDNLYEQWKNVFD